MSLNKDSKLPLVEFKMLSRFEEYWKIAIAENESGHWTPDWTRKKESTNPALQGDLATWCSVAGFYFIKFNKHNFFLSVKNHFQCVSLKNK